MAKGIDYARELSDIEAPTPGRAGETILQAGRTEAAGLERSGQLQGAALAAAGTADSIKTKGTAETISFLGTAGVAAGKGYMESQVEREIKDALGKLEGVGDQALQSQANVSRLQTPEFAGNVANQMTLLEEQSGGMEGGQFVQDFMQDISRYVTAQKQGILSRGEVLMRVSAAVKKASATMPGWAADFRKIGANLTGISNVDVYGIHQALTTKSLSERASEKAMEQRAQAISEIAREQGVLPEQVNDTMLAAHYQHKQIKLAADNAENRAKVMNAGQDEADKVWSRVAMLKVSASVADIAKDMARLGALNADPQRAMESKEFGLQLSTKLGTTLAMLERDIMEMTQPQPGKTALSVKAAQERIDGIRGIFKNYEEAVKNVEGRNMFDALVRNANSRADLMMNNFVMANPYIAGLNKLGLPASEVFKAFISLGDPQEFEKRFGKQLRQSFEAVLKNPAAHANTMVAIATGQPVDLNQIAIASPELATVAAVDLLANLKEWSKDTNADNNKKNIYSNTFAAASRTLNPMVGRDIAEVYNLVSNADTQTFLGTLSAEQRANALGPMVSKLELAAKNVGSTIVEQLNQFNNKDTNPAAKAGAVMSLRQNNLTGALELVVDTTAVTRQPRFADSPTGAAMMGPGYLPRVAALQGTAGIERNEFRQRAEKLVTDYNKILEAYTLSARAVAPDLNTNLTDVRQRGFAGLSSGEFQPLEPGVARLLGAEERQPGAAVPKNAPGESSQLDQTRVLESIVAAERSGTPRGDGTSPAGARGRYQFMPETAKRFGLKVDPSAGIDERTDVQKSGEAAFKYIGELSKMFSGDMMKVAAAYNAGEGNVQKAVAKATELGVAEQWPAFLPKPTETIPYIRRFMDKWTIKPIH